MTMMDGAYRLAITADIDQGRRNLDLLGYTIHPDFVDQATLETLCARLDEQSELEREAGVATVSSSGHAGVDRHFGGSGDGALPISQQVAFLPNKGAEFRALMHHPVAKAYAAHAFRDVPYNLVTQSGLMLRKGGKRQVLHADQQAWPFATPVPVMLNVTLCLSDYEAAMGATCIVPGSHRHPSPDLAADPETAAASIGSVLLPMEAKAGSALIFESRTWHCQGEATADRLRSAIATVYGMHFVKPQDFYPAIIHDDVYEILSEADREMLGFTVHYEYGGRIAPRHPQDRRANTNAAFPYIPELRRGSALRAIPREAMRVPRAEGQAEPIA